MRNKMRQVQPQKSAPYSVIDGPKKCDAEFYGNWLIMAGGAERFWKRLLVEQKFAKRIERLICAFIPDFGIAATDILSALLRGGAHCAVNLWDDTGEEFTMMVKMGFFAETRGRYCLEVPGTMSANIVKSAALALSETEDRDYDLHPETLVATMSNAAPNSRV